MAGAVEEGCVLASFGQRFKAAAIDTLILLIPACILISIYPKKEDIPQYVHVGLGVYLLAVAMVQGIFLVDRGQTVGKKMMHIQIVRRKDGENGGFIRNIVLRTLVNGVISFIPLYALIDILFIVSDTKRCLHDRIAGTIVVQKNTN